MSSSLLAEIMKLSVEERLALADEIYANLDDEMAAGNPLEKPTIPPGQKHELEHRFAAYEANPGIAFPIEQILAKMKSHT